MSIFNDNNQNEIPLNIKHFPELIVDLLVAEKDQNHLPKSLIEWLDSHINENYGVVWNRDSKQIVVLDGWEICPNGDIIRTN